jgi:hypothetical protein
MILGYRRAGRSCIGRQDRECIRVQRPHRPEVPLVKDQYPGRVVPGRENDDRRISQAARATPLDRA